MSPPTARPQSFALFTLYFPLSTSTLHFALCTFYFFSPASQLTSTVIGPDATCSSIAAIRNRLPSGETANRFEIALRSNNGLISPTSNVLVAPLTAAAITLESAETKNRILPSRRQRANRPPVEETRHLSPA